MNEKAPVEYFAALWTEEWANALEPTIQTLATANDESQRFEDAECRLGDRAIRTWANGELAEAVCRHLQNSTDSARFAVLQDPDPYGSEWYLLGVSPRFGVVSDETGELIDAIVDDFFKRHADPTRDKADAPQNPPSIKRFEVRSAAERKASKAKISAAKKATKAKQTESGGCVLLIVGGVLLAAAGAAILT